MCFLSAFRDGSLTIQSRNRHCPEFPPGGTLAGVETLYQQYEVGTHYQNFMREFGRTRSVGLFQWLYYIALIRMIQ